MKFIHLVSHTGRGSHSLNFHSFRWLWSHLRKTFPSAIAIVIMPDHIHVIDQSKSPYDSQIKLRHLLTRFRQHRISKNTYWKEVQLPTVIPNLKHLNRTIRYLALNPCRDRLAKDPLNWLWSSYRDLFGANHLPLISTNDLAGILRMREAFFKKTFHQYVSADPSVAVSGTDFPKAAKSTSYSIYPLHDIALATAASLRSHPADIRSRSETRHVFLHLAVNQGWTDVKNLALACGVNRRSVYYALRRPCEKKLQAALVCLGDRRLRVPEFFEN